MLRPPKSTGSSSVRRETSSTACLRKRSVCAELAVNLIQDLDRGVPASLVARAEVDAKEMRRRELELLHVASAKIDRDGSGNC